VLATPTPVAYVQEHLSNEGEARARDERVSTARARCSTTASRPASTPSCGRRIPKGCCARRAEFEAVRDAIGAGIVERMFETVALVARILRTAREADRAISGASSIQLMAALGDARTQLEALVPAGFVSATGLERLRHLPRYLDAIVVRVRKLVENPGRDRQAIEPAGAVDRGLRGRGRPHPDRPRGAPAPRARAMDARGACGSACSRRSCARARRLSAAADRQGARRLTRAGTSASLEWTDRGKLLRPPQNLGRRSPSSPPS
jgi:ATP-dependent helicase HrpA